MDSPRRNKGHEQKQLRSLLISLAGFAVGVPLLALGLIYAIRYWQGGTPGIGDWKTVALCVWAGTMLAVIRAALSPVLRERSLRKKVEREERGRGKKSEERDALEMLIDLFKCAIFVPLLCAVFIWGYCRYYSISLERSDIKNMVFIVWAATLLALGIKVALRRRG